MEPFRLHKWSIHTTASTIQKPESSEEYSIRAHSVHHEPNVAFQQ